MKKLLISCLLIGIAGLAIAQQAGFKRTLLQTQDLSVSEKVVVQAVAEFEPGVAAGRHTHPGEEMGYVLEGQIEIKIDGQPSKIVQAGQTFFIPNGLVHDGINTSSGKLKVLATYVVDKGKPVATPAK
ncbi:cupin domain-containing protein [Polynucleobacter rarus]|jgi:quercetin dioxygenase-like cupin family protein|uniref:cupin domain-containing protein n=1 Tax=Polynucleobacter rarus TaxID=556055 RepID=UPI000D3EC458|nr:cupin domain-containing protein [Polynucleobacter rarus]